MSAAPTEPSADLRAMASFCWQTFVALKSEGFTEAQALTIVGELLRATIPPA
jgi:hypothetical protein